MPVPIRLCRQLTVIARHAWARGLVEDGLKFARPRVLLRFTLPSYEHWEDCDPEGNLKGKGRYRKATGAC